MKRIRGVRRVAEHQTKPGGGRRESSGGGGGRRRCIAGPADACSIKIGSSPGMRTPRGKPSRRRWRMWSG